MATSPKEALRNFKIKVKNDFSLLKPHTLSSEEEAANTLFTLVSGTLSTNIKFKTFSCYNDHRKIQLFDYFFINVVNFNIVLFIVISIVIK